MALPALPVVQQLLGWLCPHTFITPQAHAPSACSLIAKIPDPARPSKLTVGFSRPNSTDQIEPGPYWVIGTGGSRPGKYDWAIVSGGPPIVKGEQGCRTGNDRQVRVCNGLQWPGMQAACYM
jgi:hypothetical protein